jgi:hypothetical protein
MSAGRVNEGADASTTVIVCVLVLAFPQASDAVHVRVMVPEPLQSERFAWSAYVTVGVEQASVAVA